MSGVMQGNKRWQAIYVCMLIILGYHRSVSPNEDQNANARLDLLQASEHGGPRESEKAKYKIKNWLGRPLDSYSQECWTRATFVNDLIQLSICGRKLFDEKLLAEERDKIPDQEVHMCRAACCIHTRFFIPECLAPPSVEECVDI